MHVDLIIDGQWGSTGKGKLADFLLFQMGVPYIASVCDFMSNAGHTAVVDGKKRVLCQLPMAAYAEDIPVFLGAGCAITIETLMEEIEKTNCGEGRLFIHPNAVIISTMLYWQVCLSLAKLQTIVVST